MSIKKHKIKYAVLAVLLAVVLFFIFNIIWSNNVLTYSEYTVESPKLKGSTVCVAISDTEGRTFGENNQRLVDKIKGANPEFVLILGDMIDEENKSYDGVLSLCKTLTKDYPVYYTLGNHELSMIEWGVYEDFVRDIKATGTHLLINEMEDYTTKSGDRLTIAGLKTFPFFEVDAPDYNNEENRLFKSYLKQEDDSHLSLLLCHYPETYIWGLDEYNIDLMLSGHAHGGLIRLPFTQGLYAPEQGYFPKYTKGYYTNGKANMLISAGLSSSGGVPRFLNPLDVMVITFKGE